MKAKENEPNPLVFLRLRKNLYSLLLLWGSL